MQPSLKIARRRGFTLIELLVVLGIIALLLTLAVPRFFPSIDKSRETILADNLRNTREIIGQFYSDTGRYPDTLDQLVEKKYLRNLPMDPITESNSTWVVVPPEDGALGGVYDIRSGAPGNDRSGKPYADW
jgi:general secretion pathway protein G